MQEWCGGKVAEHISCSQNNPEPIPHTTTNTNQTNLA